jgi:broad specificity phosphatase PhoE
MSLPGPEVSGPTAANDATCTHDAVTLALAKQESTELLIGMATIYQSFRSKPLTIKAYPVDHKHTPNPDPSFYETIKTVHFVRHGQGFHNLLADKAAASGLHWEQFDDTPENPYMAPELTDAPLTEKGRQQALHLRENQVKNLFSPPQLIVLSPNCRALQTGLLAFADSFTKVPFIAHELVREQTGVHLCDKRRPIDLQAMEFPQIDFSLISSNHDAIFQTNQRETNLQVAERASGFLEWLALREEDHVAVASHSGWLLTLMNAVVQVEPEHEHLKAWFQTGEMRSCTIVFRKQV